MKNKKDIQQIRDRFNHFIDNPADEDEKISLNSAARGIGVSVTALSQFANDKYPGKNDVLAEKIEAYMQRQFERQNVNEIFDVTMDTTAVQRLMQTARMCHIQREIGVATGEAGVGKTRACKLYTERNPDVILIEVFPYTGAKTIMSELHKRAGYNGRGTIHTMFQDVSEKLKNSGRLIIVDEAEHLPYLALELLRRLHDLAGIGILMVGMPRLIVNLRGNQGEFRQLYSRIGIHTVIPGLSEDDSQVLIHSALPNSNGLWKDFHKHTNNARSLSKLLKRSMQVAEVNDTEVNGPVINEAKQYIII